MKASAWLRRFFLVLHSEDVLSMDASSSTLNLSGGFTSSSSLEDVTAIKTSIINLVNVQINIKNYLHYVQMTSILSPLPFRSPPHRLPPLRRHPKYRPSWETESW